jgi:hypothetical protein
MYREKRLGYNNVTEAVMFLTCIREGLCSNLGWNTAYPY